MTTIDGFKVSMDDSDGNTQCWIEKGSCCSSLAKVEHTGQVEDMDTGKTVDVPETTQDKIRAWAEARGY